MQRLVVVYDYGAVRPIEAFLALRDVAELIFVPAASEHARRQIPVMERFARVVHPGNSNSETARCLRAFHPDGILTFSERCLPTVTALGHALGLQHHDATVLQGLVDKFVQRRLLRDAGVDLTRSVEVASRDELMRAIEVIGTSAVVKPCRHSGGSRNTYKITGVASARAVADLILPDGGPAAEASFVVEELLVGRPSGRIGDYVSVESVVVDGAVVHFAVTGKLPTLTPFRETGQFWPAQISGATEVAILDLTDRALRALGVASGVTHTEIKLTATGPRIIEVNGRIGGHIEELCHRTGYPSAVWLAASAALGLEVQLPEHRSEQVCWQHNNLAPLQPCVVEAIRGTHDVLAAPGVSAYRPYVAPGERLPGGVETRMIDITCGEAVDHTAMHEQIDEALSRLCFILRFGDRTHHVSARRLRTL